jgi:hypothetical protein
MNNGQLGVIEKQGATLPNPLEVHTADSKWQFCNCETCQRRRMLIDSCPGTPIKYETYRHKDEKY